MKKLKMIVTSVIVLAIVCSAFAFNTKKIGRFCVTANLNSTLCNQTISSQKRVAGINNRYYVVDWDGSGCDLLSPFTCTTSAHFEGN